MVSRGPKRLAIGTVALLLALAASNGVAGEAIVVPSDKAKSAPSEAASKAAARDLFKFRDILPSASPLDVLTIPMAPERQTPFDPKEEKRRKLERLERQNWMMVAPGELQAEEEERNFLNVRDPSLDDLDSNQDGPNLMFRESKKDGTRHPGQLRSVDAAKSRVPATSDDTVDSRKPERDPRIGAHMSSALDLKRMFEPRQGGDSLSPKFHKSDLTLHGLLNSGGPSELTRGQQARREEFRTFLNRPQTANPIAGPSDPINTRSDFTRQPFNPTVPQAPAAWNSGAFGSGSGFARQNSGGYSSFGPNAQNNNLLNQPVDSRPKAAASSEPPRRRF